MTTFNFTVRAVDDRGAYADRDFSIKVRNTIVDRYVAMSNNGHAYTSVDGSTWVQRVNVGINSPGADYYNNIIFGNGIWLMPYNASIYKISFDGITWAERELPIAFTASNNLTEARATPRFTYHNGKFTSIMYEMNGTVVDRVVFESQDGLEWTRKWVFPTGAAPSASVFNHRISSHVCFGDNGMIIIPSYSNVTATRTIQVSRDNGETWQEVDPGLGQVGRIVYHNGLFIAMSYANFGIRTSVDGFAWTTIAVPAIANGGWANIMYGNGRLVAIPLRAPTTTSTQGSSGNYVYTSTNGETWEKIDLPFTMHSASSSNGSGMSSFYHNGMFFMFSTRPSSPTVAVGASSPDGINWTPIPLATFPGASGGIHTAGGMSED